MTTGKVIPSGIRHKTLIRAGIEAQEVGEPVANAIWGSAARCSPPLDVFEIGRILNWVETEGKMIVEVKDREWFELAEKGNWDDTWGFGWDDPDLGIGVKAKEWRGKNRK